MFGLFSPPPPPQPSEIPAGVVLLAFGDVHGSAHLLKPLLGAFTADLSPSMAQRVILVGMGDYIDRGLESQQVLNLLVRITQASSIETHFLRGNHEQILLNFLVDPAAVGPRWLTYGGRETLASYGIVLPEIPGSPKAWEDCRDALQEAMPAAHLTFLQGLESSFSIGDYFFAHAGVRPDVPLDRQVDDDLLWIREPFLKPGKPLSKVVVHGHTPEAGVHADNRRIGIDTGAYATGVLTGLRLEGRSRRLLQTYRRESEGFGVTVADLAA